LRALLRAYNPAISQVFPGPKFHHQAVYALLQHYTFPDECVEAGVEAITALLKAHCRTAFGREHAEQLVSLCRKTLTRQIGREEIRQRVFHLIDDISTCQERKSYFNKTGYHLIKDRPEATLLIQATGAGISNTLALVSEIGDVHRFSDGEHLASFLGLTTSKHISGTTLFVSKHITKQGSPNGRYAAVNVAQHMSQCVPKYQRMYERIKNRKPPRKGHYIALVAVARDFVTNVLYDMWRYKRPFFREVEDYRAYRRKNPRADEE
jgi:transposase